MATFFEKSATYAPCTPSALEKNTVISRPGSPLSEKRSRSLDIPSIILTEPAPPPSPTLPSTPKSILLLPSSVAIVPEYVPARSCFPLRGAPSWRGLLTVIILLAMGFHLWAQLGSNVHPSEVEQPQL